jgi:hypothetical protein
MAGDQPVSERRDSAAEAVPEPVTGSPEGIEAGDPACWACMVCEECGAVASEGHAAGCSQPSVATSVRAGQ